jgi:cryptochrome
VLACDSLQVRGSQLICLRGKPAEVFPGLFAQWSITKLCYEFDTEPYARQRDAEVDRLAAKAGVSVCSPVSHTLYVSSQA